MAANRSLGRDVHFYDISRQDQALGGLMLTPSITKRTFLFALGILIVSAHPYDVYLRGTDTPVRPTDEPLQAGKYDIKPDSPYGRVFITNEWCITRILSQTVSGRDEAFRQRVRERDRKCVITGVANPDRLVALNDWSSYHAAHIFPLSGEDWFIRNSFSRWSTNRAGERDTGINSCQNGLLMLSHIHEKFDNFSISINPDDNYRIITFRDDVFNVGGRLLDPVCRDPSDENSVRDELLRWHFRQAVLANIRRDFPPGSDMVGEIRNGPDAVKRMEAELFSRLGGLSLT
ncbi:HNH endonuclease-domain-containing protein [Lipomyces tetrasporus]|uniref:HNH endonuclease-domain-containing protein n=1 Tax=Lipomyces tetrasporus TaxID=54092 RepID=A0AAD7QT03_9ASCO|nr:HNH endonuclease-domain-containing protein [Lipomyces tetrasporus]KAJ8100800.1 HNH endonuclease-domain-containing protein [Lipomyces tetrasporus]